MHFYLRYCLLIGIPVSVCCMLLTAAALTLPDIPFSLYALFAAFPIMLGCFLSAYFAGKSRRRHGIRTGSICALLLSVCWLTACSLMNGGFAYPLLFLSVPCGILGGILGVNARLPLPHKRSHTIPAMQKRAAMLPARLHRPQNHTQST